MGPTDSVVVVVLMSGVVIIPAVGGAVADVADGKEVDDFAGTRGPARSCKVVISVVAADAALNDDSCCVSGVARAGGVWGLGDGNDD